MNGNVGGQVGAAGAALINVTNTPGPGVLFFDGIDLGVPADNTAAIIAQLIASYGSGLSSVTSTIFPMNNNTTTEENENGDEINPAGEPSGSAATQGDSGDFTISNMRVESAPPAGTHGLSGCASIGSNVELCSRVSHTP